MLVIFGFLLTVKEIPDELRCPHLFADGTSRNGRGRIVRAARQDAAHGTVRLQGKIGQGAAGRTIKEGR